ncbi:MAG TPA: response regulator [Spongiibacteraceae bacterium]|nr:response regulator [Spongiibacteraceae bacterium]
MQKIDLIKIYKRKTALVVDDYPDMRGSIRRMLVNFGVETVDMAANGEEAIQRCEEKHYDIILCDYNLGESKNGQQILEELRYRNLLRNTSLYMMITAETTRSMVFGALEYQPDEYLTKPFTQGVLQKRLDRLVLEKEALYEINQAMDQLDFERAIALCDQHINASTRFEQKCYRIKAKCLYEKQRYDQSREIYQKMLHERSVDWAEIGLGRSLIALGELDQAEALFEKLVDDGCLSLEIYDHLADIRNRKGDVAGAQGLLEKAIEISPNAILRQRHLAEISEDNADWVRAEKAHRRVVKLGAHSCYEEPENYFKLARCISTQLRESDVKDSRRLRDAEDVLNRARRRYSNNEQVLLQSEIINATVYADAGQLDESARRIAALEQRIERAARPPAGLFLDVVKTYRALGQHDKATAILKDLAAKYEDDEAVCDAIDRLAEEPLSRRGKEQAIELNREGKVLFADQNYQQAIGLFDQALKHYPNNIAVNLNLLLALVKEMSSSGASRRHVERCDQLIKNIDHMDSGHTLYERFTVLRSHVDKLRAAAH